MFLWAGINFACCIYFIFVYSYQIISPFVLHRTFDPFSNHDLSNDDFLITKDKWLRHISHYFRKKVRCAKIKCQAKGATLKNKSTQRAKIRMQNSIELIVWIKCHNWELLLKLPLRPLGKVETRRLRGEGFSTRFFLIRMKHVWLWIRWLLFRRF